MKPAPFEYQAPSSLDAALDLLSHRGGDAKVLAGGQSLIPVMNFRLAEPALLVDINKLAELDFIRRGDDGGLRIGALTRQRRLERDALVAEAAPLLHETIPFIAHPQIRNRGTFGGSLAHADPAAELPAVAVALRARFRLRKAGGDRWVNASDFFGGLFTTSLKPDEILVEVAIPPSPERTGWSFLEIARRHGDYAQIGIAALVTLDDVGRCREARLVYLSAGDVPIEARQAAGLLAGQEISAAAISAAADQAAREIRPFSDLHATADFKRHLARVITGRALRKAVDRAGRANGRTTG
ncbi:MAG TPA: xanthine dehydrogenase family protein subunit M [Thermoanaerobaculia bacterium]|jgi:carbon-monoxide dehydrogenase medium subunit|nr:xanthine dehydrogenase family protein subunit M [Thermoanaerobaculia bacterium]